MSVSTAADKLAERWAAIPATARPAVTELIRVLVHELNSPLSTIGMELDSARCLLEGDDNSAGPAPARGDAAVYRELLQILVYLEKASSRLIAATEALARLTIEEAGCDEE